MQSKQLVINQGVKMDEVMMPEVDPEETKEPVDPKANTVEDKEDTKSPVAPKTKSKMMPVLLAIIIVLILAGTAYFLLK